MSSKDKYHLSPEAGSTSAASDDEMETSFSSFKTTTEKGSFNPLYDVGGDCSTNSSDAESPCPEEDDLKKSRGRKRRQNVSKR